MSFLPFGLALSTSLVPFVQPSSAWSATGTPAASATTPEARATPAPSALATAPEHAKLASDVVAQHAKLVHATYATLVTSLETLSTRVAAFVEAPSAKTLASAKEAWVASRKVYGLTEAFRFYGGPIDDPKTGPEGLMNAWPLDESYLDAVKGGASAGGLVGNTKAFPEITKDVLLSLNEKDGEKNISTGYHAIEFLLWGQDFNAKGAGSRTALDYVDDGKNHAPRRARTLVLLTDILLGHARELEKAWAPGVAGNFASSFVALPVSDALQKMLTGVAVLSVDEMAGERMIVALSKNDEENEQSCFSDTTTNDFVANAKGISNIWNGRCTGGCQNGPKQGPGLRALVQALDAPLARTLDDALNRSQRLLGAIPAPFDRVIASPPSSKGRKTAEAAIASLEAQGKLFARVATKLGVEINVQE